ncbi:MAG: protein-methionine-sulfoxide reductase heme-binding subunit MsrQ [Bryobacteraceae bacterium]
MLRRRWVKPLLFLLCLIPLALLTYRWQTNQLGFNRAETVARFTGDWTLRMLLFSLTITPLRRITGWNDLIRFRRMLGLFAFFYGSLHLFHYLSIDKAWFWPEIWDDLTVRRFFIMGWTAFLLMVPLALTSTTAAIRKLGKNWARLHRLAYLSAVAGVVHFYWQGKAALWDPILYGVAVVILLGMRLGLSLLSKRPKVAAPA